MSEVAEPSAMRCVEASTGAAGTAVIELQVERIVPAADGVIALELRAADGAPLPAWSPGAHVDLLLEGGLDRQYSLCGDPADHRRWRVAVLREPDSRGGSAWLHGRLRAGDTLRVRGPRNNFPLVDAAGYLFIAGGIGITPLLPMIGEAARCGACWSLLYGGRTLGSMAFAAELALYGERVRICPEDRCGLLDLDTWLGVPVAGVAVYCCGPERLLQAVEARWADWPEGSLHVERFRPRPGALQGEPTAPEGEFEVVLARSGLACKVAPGQTIIDALDRAGVHVPRSCGEGTCGTCLTPVIEGVPDHRDSFLMGKKRAANKSICVCCSRALSPRLVLDL